MRAEWYRELKGHWLLEACALQPGRTWESGPSFLCPHPRVGVPTGIGSTLTAQAADGIQASLAGVGGVAQRPDGVCGGKRPGSSRIVCQPPTTSLPQPLASYSLMIGKTQPALDFIKQVYSHFRKTNSGTGKASLQAGYEIKNRRPEGGVGNKGVGSGGHAPPRWVGVGQIN